MRNKRSILSFLLIMSVSFLLVGCSETTGTKKNDDSLTIYTTVYPLQYFAERLGGNYVQVDTVYPPGADEHTFEPTQKDMMKLADSDLFIYIGLGLEGFVESSKDTLKNEHVKLVEAGKQVHLDHAEHKEEEQEVHDESDGHNHGDVDPHIWLDPVYSKELVAAIEKELIKKLPDHKDKISANSDKLMSELDQLDASFKKVVDQSSHKEMVVSHSAFGYWEERYGLEQISISGLSTSNEPTQKELQNIISDARKNKIKYVFFEQNVTSKLAGIVQEEIGAQPLTLHNLSVLTEDDIKQNRNYMSIMKDNLDALKKALN